jgi:hypothetical protein
MEIKCNGAYALLAIEFKFMVEKIYNYFLNGSKSMIYKWNRNLQLVYGS